MDKNTYFKISQDKNLPNRCPILNICERRATSIFLLSYFDKETKGKTWNQILIDSGELSNDFESTKIPIQGESPVRISGNSNFYLGDLCPEVNLFDSSHSIVFPKTACTSVSYDKYFTSDNKLIVSEYRHFSDCSEFCKHTFDNKNLSKYNDKNTINKHDLKQLVVEKLEDAMQVVHDSLREKSDDIGLNQIIIVKSNYQDLIKKEIAGTISIEESRLVKSQLINRLLNLIDSLS